VEYANAVNNRAWIWIDLCPVPGVTPTTFQPAVISAASVTSGSVLYASTNTRGFFVTASPATVTATLSNATDKFNWCAYGSDAPPNVTAPNGTYTFKGTPPFILTDASGTITQTVTGNTLPASALTVTPVSLTDKTGYPGVFCIYSGSDLYIDAIHLCQQRPSGAGNWEAWIKDTRDNELYRIVFLPDTKWWTAEEMRYDASATKQSYKCPNEIQLMLYNRPNVACPTGWSLPSVADIRNLRSFMSLAELLTVATHPCCGTGVDKYGFSVVQSTLRIDIDNTDLPSGDCRSDFKATIPHGWDTSDGMRCELVTDSQIVYTCNLSWNSTRCIRQL
jgi:uncharacterized protein (TIGR02145 family)